MTIRAGIREAAARIKCGSNLRQLNIALVAYAATYRGFVPIGYGVQKQSSYLIFENLPSCVFTVVVTGFATGPMSG